MRFGRAPVRHIWGSIGFIVTLFAGSSLAQPASSWLRFSYDRSGHGSIALASDGGYIDAQNKGYFALGPALFQKLDSSGNLQWRKTYSSTYGLIPFSIAESSDGGYIVGGTAHAATFVHYFWLLKLDPTGNAVWNRILDLSNDSDRFDDIKQTNDGGYLAAGTACLDNCRMIISKLDGQGNVLWQKITSAGNYSARKVLETAEGDYLVTGVTDRSGAGLWDIFIAKLDATGALLWQQTYGTENNETVLDFQKAPDGGLILAGLSFSELTESPFLLKLDAFGNIQWQQKYLVYHINSVEPIQDGGYVITGDKYVAQLGFQAILLQVDSVGNPNLFQTYPGLEQGLTASETIGGGYQIAGTSQSLVTSINASWFARLDDDGSLDCAMSQSQAATSDPINLIALPGIESLSDVSTIELTATLTVLDTHISPAQSCAGLFWDNFDDGVLDQNWKYRGSWHEGRYLSGNSGSAIASPVFAGCNICSVEADIEFFGGPSEKVSLLGWYKDRKNLLQILMNYTTQRLIMKQKSNGKVVRMQKSPRVLDTFVGHHVKVVFDGHAFHLYLDNILQMSMQSFPGTNPFGTVGFQVKAGQGRFDSLTVSKN